MRLRLAGPFRAVIFDLDGTLLDSAADLACAANQTLAELGLPRRDERLIATFIGKGIAKLVERSLAGRVDGTADAGLLARALPIFERCYEHESGRQTTVFPGVLAGLDALKREAIPLACVTNKSGRFTAVLLEKTGLASYFDVVVGGDTLERKKPDPLPFTYACARLGAAPAQALVVGDSENDVVGARAAGCPVVCVPYGYNEGRPIQSAGCDGVVSSVLEAAMLVLSAREQSISTVHR